jgi:hypothetical protein
MLVHPLCCNDDRAGELGPTFHFMTRHDLVLANDKERQRATQLELPIQMVGRISILYVEMDGTGIPVVRQETEGRAGKQDGQPAHTREAKLGCVFTQTQVDEEGYPIRDEASTSYVGGIESCEEFGRRLYAEAWRRGWARAEKQVVLGDGAEWIWNQADLHFPGAIQIVDITPASTCGIYRPNSIPTIRPPRDAR